MNRTAEKSIVLGRVLNDLDFFVLDFVKVLEKHAKYAIVSGYTALLFGRSRSTEDVDVLVMPIDKSSFTALYKELRSKGFWCINAENANELYDNYLMKKVAIRFAKEGEVIPNMEFKFIRNLFDGNTIKNALEVKTPKGAILIGPIEEEIAYKRVVLGSEKDNEDALFLENMFSGKLDGEKIKKCAAYLRKHENL